MSTTTPNENPNPPLADATGYAIGDEVHITIKGVTNDRKYQGAGEILSITGNYAKVRYRQPWARPHNCMREMLVDLRSHKKIKRRLRHNYLLTGKPFLLSG
jgi:hypothetical protein